jgi:hypothetical protein
LQTYQSDLNYILNFQRFKVDNNDFEKYLTKDPGTFKSFIDEFKVARTFRKDETSNLLSLTLKWINRKDCNNVDGFAKHLRDHKITDGKIPISLASKILFLNNPWVIIPFDSRTKKALGLRYNSYSHYQELALQYKKKNQAIIDNSLTFLKTYFGELENDYKSKLFKIEIIRENRFVDKLLWTIGEKQKHPLTSPHPASRGS